MTALATLPDIAQVALWGDSLTDGSYLNHATAQGGLGSWAEQLAEELAAFLGRPVLSSGFIGQLTGLQWSRAGTFKTAYSTAVASGSAGQHANALTAGNLNVARASGMPASGTLVLSNGVATCVLTYTARTTTQFTGVTFTSGTDFVLAVGNVVAIGNAGTADAYINMAPQGIGFFADAGSSSIATFTRPSTWRAAVGVAVYFVDYSAGGSWQYRIDGGTWTNHGQTLLHNDRIVKFYLPTAVTSTIEFRAYDGAVAAGMFVLGVELFYVDARAAGTRGVIVHDFGINGWTLNDSACVTTTGDRYAILDAVAAGTGSPITNTPNVGCVEMFLANDTVFNDTASFGTQLTTFYNRTTALGPVAFIGTHELGGGTGTLQASYRSTISSTAASLGAVYHSFFDDYSNLGYGGVGAQNAAISAAGLLADTVHFTQRGHDDIGSRMTWIVIGSFLGGVVSTTTRAFKVGSSSVGGTDVLGGVMAQPWTRAATDSALGGSSLARAAGHPRSLSDSGLGGSSLARTVGHPRATTDSALGASSVSTSGSRSRSLTDSMSPQTVAFTGGDGIVAGQLTLTGAPSAIVYRVEEPVIGRVNGEILSQFGSTTFSGLGLNGDATFDRIDLVVYRRSGPGVGTVVDLPGTPAASPVAPPPAAGDLLLGSVRVPAGATNDALCTLTDLRTLISYRAVGDPRALTDAALGSSSVTRAISRAATDTGLGGSALARTATHPRSLTDTALGGTALTRTPGTPRNLADTALGGTALTRTETLLRALSDASVGTSALTDSLGHSRSLSDTSLDGSSLARAAAHPRTAADTALGSSSLVRTFPTSRAVTDTALGGTSLARVEHDSRTLADTSVGGSSLARLVALTRSLADAALGGSFATASGANSPHVTDTALGTSSVTRTSTRGRSLTDSMSPQLAPFGGDGVISGGRVSGAGGSGITSLPNNTPQFANTDVVAILAGQYRQMISNFVVGIPADATFPRIDSYIMNSPGAYFGFTGYSVDTQVIGGVAAASPVPPPSNHYPNADYIILASILVPAGATDSAQCTITDVRNFVSWRSVAQARPIVDVALGASSLARAAGRARALADTSLGGSSIGRTFGAARTSGDTSLGDSSTSGAAIRSNVDTSLGTSSLARTGARSRSLTDQMSPQLAPFGTHGVLSGGGIRADAGAFQLRFAIDPVSALVGGQVATSPDPAGFFNVALGDATFPRIDLYSMTAIGPTIEVGTPAAIPVAPSGDATHEPLAEIHVPAGATNSSQCTIVDVRAFVSYRTFVATRPITDVALGGSSIVAGRRRTVVDVALGSSSLAHQFGYLRSITNSALGGSHVTVSGSAVVTSPTSAFGASQGGTVVAWRAGGTRTSIGAGSTVSA